MLGSHTNGNTAVFLVVDGKEQAVPEATAVVRNHPLPRVHQVMLATTESPSAPATELATAQPATPCSSIPCLDEFLNRWRRGKQGLKPATEAKLDDYLKITRRYVDTSRWVLFCDLGQRDLRFMSLGCLQSFQAITVTGQTNVAILYDRDELNWFLDEQFRQTQERCSWFRGMKRILLLRRREVLAYFRQPLDSISFIPKSPQRPRPVPPRANAPEWRIRRR